MYSLERRAGLTGVCFEVDGRGVSCPSGGGVVGVTGLGVSACVRLRASYVYTTCTCYDMPYMRIVTYLEHNSKIILRIRKNVGTWTYACALIRNNVIFMLNIKMLFPTIKILIYKSITNNSENPLYILIIVQIHVMDKRLNC